MPLESCFFVPVKCFIITLNNIFSISIHPSKPTLNIDVPIYCHFVPLTNLFITFHTVIRHPVHNITALKFRVYNEKASSNLNTTSNINIDISN